MPINYDTKKMRIELSIYIDQYICWINRFTLYIYVNQSHLALGSIKLDIEGKRTMQYFFKDDFNKHKDRMVNFAEEFKHDEEE